ncbi:MAG: MFS transporter [Gammaproteobacteria bacterium]|nr:MFS transporter [Gammaproteobacteria bacterium]
MRTLNLHNMRFIPVNAIPWIIWSIAGLYYFFEIIIRTLPSTMSGTLMQIFQINATSLSMLTSFFYYIAYTVMQIPAGLLVDRYSVRRVLFIACLSCIFGFIVFYSTRNLHLAEFGRLVVGLGSAFAYVSALKVASVWLSRRHFGFATTIMDSLGMLGAMFADDVLAHINIVDGMQSSINLLIGIGLFIAFLIVFVLKDTPDTKVKNKNQSCLNTNDKTNIFKKLCLIGKNPQIWLVGVVGCLFYLPSAVIGDLFGIPFLKTVYHLSRSSAPLCMSVFFAGWIICGPLFGAYSDKVGKRCKPLIISMLIEAVLFSILLYTPVITGHIIPESALYILFFFMGVAMGTHPLVFAIAKENYSNKIAGTVIAFTNTLIMLSGLVITPLVGYLLDYSHHSIATAGVENYTMANYMFALTLIPISLIICVIIMVFVKETGSLKEDVEEKYDRALAMLNRK